MLDKMNEQAQPSSNRQEKPFRVLNLTFATKKVFFDFIWASLLIILVPIISVVVLNKLTCEHPGLTELQKVIVSVGPSIVFINIVMGVYVYRAIKDPENYKADEPLKMKMKKK